MGNKTGKRAVMLPPIRFQCWDFNCNPLHIHTVQLTICMLNSELCKIRLAPHLPGHNWYVKQSVSIMLFVYEVTSVNKMLVPLPYLSHICLNFPYIEGDRATYWPNRDTLTHTIVLLYWWTFNPYPTAFPYGNGMVLHFYQQQESSTTKTVHKVINKGLKTYV